MSQYCDYSGRTLPDMARWRRSQ